MMAAVQGGWHARVLTAPVTAGPAAVLHADLSAPAQDNCIKVVLKPTHRPLVVVQHR
jgi:hypothetical protein